MTLMIEREERRTRKKRRAPRLLRRLGAIVALALAITLANVFSPIMKNWFSGLLPKVDYNSAVERLTHSTIKEVVVTNTIPQRSNAVLENDKFRILSVGSLLGEAMRSINNNLSVSRLFD